jgi:hypothetical protein
VFILFIFSHKVFGRFFLFLRRKKHGDYHWILFLGGYFFFLNIQRSIEYAQEQFDIVGSSIAPFDNSAFLIFISINIKTDENIKDSIIFHPRSSNKCPPGG